MTRKPPRCALCKTFWQPEKAERHLRFDWALHDLVCTNDAACRARRRVRTFLDTVSPRR